MSESAEQLASRLCTLPLSELSPAEANERIVGVLGDADLDVRQAALDLAAAIIRERSAAAVRHAASWELITRLSNATGCPDGTSAVIWLEGLGLIEPDGVGGYAATPRATLRVVDKDSP